jgi:hypothetical protein
MLAIASLASLVVLAGSLVWFRAVLPEADRTSLAMPIAGVYLWIAPIAMACQIAGWTMALAARRLTAVSLGAITAGVIGFVLAAVVLREVVRMGRKNMEALLDAHQTAAQVGGLFVFLLFFVLNAVLITGCVVLVRRGLAARASS